jgi:hypothetical protein
VDTLTKIVKSGIFSNSPNVMMQIITVRGLLTRDKKDLNSRNRYALMMQANLQKLLDHYRPLLTALFEFYLYEAYLPS